jgi:hypothetical protein
MNKFFNLATNLILIKDLSNTIDFDLLRSEFDKLEFTRNKYNDISVDQNLLNQEKFVDIKQVLENEVGNYLRNAYGAEDFDSITISQSWANRTEESGSHQDHAHPFSIVSGVLYLDDNPDNLNFAMNTNFQEIPCYLYRKQSYATIKDLAGTENNLKNHLLLILSNVGHRVLPSKTTTIRRTIAFNTFWQGHTGTSDPLNSKVF